MSSSHKKYPPFDLSRLTLLPLAMRRNDYSWTQILQLEPRETHYEDLNTVAGRIVRSVKLGAPVILMMGAHVLRSGVQRYLIDLMEKGHLSCLALNGAGLIHDYELALIGQTTESVSQYIREGQFGLWSETGRINDIIIQAAIDCMGLGESVGKAIEEGNFPHKDISISAAAWRLGIPLTVHVGIGYDITHEHPNFSGAAYGAASYTDFLQFAGVVEHLEGGVAACFGSAVMAPEVFLKALAMARNAARAEKQEIRSFTILVCDLYPLRNDFHLEPDPSQQGYYFRPWKTLLVRTVSDGGESFYVQAPHRETIPELWTAIQKRV